MDQLALVVESPGTGGRHAVEAAGFRVVVADSGERALFECGQNAFDLVVVALDLPGMSGVDVCRELRGRSRAPILTISAGTGTGPLAALDAGADDHLRIPFAPGELRARARAVVRRRSGSLAPARTVRLGAAVLRIAAGQAAIVEPAVPLEPFESALLAVLCERPGVVVSRAGVAERLSASRPGWSARPLDELVDRLNDALSSAGGPAVQRMPSGGYLLPGDPAGGRAR